MKKIVIAIFLLALCQLSYSQNVGIGTTNPEASAALEIKSTGKGFLLPRMNSTQRNFIPSPATGLMVFDTDKGMIFMYDGTQWLPLAVSTNNLYIQDRTAVTPSLDAGFGFKVAISGNYAAISTRKGAVPGNGPLIDTVFVFEKLFGSWTFRTKLLQSDGVSGDGFGQSLAIGGDYIMVGAPYRNGHTGAVYVYERNGVNWQQIAILTASIPQAGSRFGSSIAMTSIFALVGAPQYISNGIQRGTVYNFSRNISTWTQVQQLWGINTLTGFGKSIDISGTYALIGAPESDYNGLDKSGIAYFYRQTGQIWNPGDTIYNPSPQADDQFGYAVTLNQSTNRAFISRPFRVGWNNNKGEVLNYAIAVQPIGFVHQGTLTNHTSHIESLSEFGHAIAMYNDYLVVGIPYAYNQNAAYGRIYIYKFDDSFSDVGDKWQPWKLIIDPNLISFNTSVDTYGNNIAINGTDVLISNWGANNMKGKVRFMELY